MIKSKRFEQLDKLIVEHDGMLRTSQVIDCGIAKAIFYEYVKRKIFNRLPMVSMFPKMLGLMGCSFYICDAARQYFPMNQRYFS